MHGAQLGDPMKAAAAIDRALAAEKTPLRLQLGEDAIGAIRDHANQLLQDLEDWAPVGSDTQIEGATASARPLTSR